MSKRVYLPFDVAVKARDWILANREMLEFKQCGMEEIARIATSAIGVTITRGQLNNVMKGVDPPLRHLARYFMPVVAAAAASPANEKLAEAQRQIETKISQIEEAIVELSSKIEDIAESVKANAAKVDTVFDQVVVLSDKIKLYQPQIDTLKTTLASHKECIVQIRTDLEKALTELGFRKLNAGVFAAAVTAAKK